MTHSFLKVPAGGEFQSIARAVVFYFEQRNNLFADQLALKELGFPLANIRKRISEWLGISADEAVSCLEPARIRNAIDTTNKEMNKEDASTSAIRIVKMTDKEFADTREPLKIYYAFYDSVYGHTIIANTPKGICFLVFSDDADEKVLNQLRKKFPQSVVTQRNNEMQQHGLTLINNGLAGNQKIRLHIRGTEFQIKVWEKLVRIPFGGLMSYSKLTDDRRFSHAFGAAVGANPVACIIPCHRVIPATGAVGEYHWSTIRKAAIICRENVMCRSLS